MVDSRAPPQTVIEVPMHVEGTLRDASAIVHALVDVSVRETLGIVERRRRGREALQTLDALALPVAVFGMSGTRPLMNRAWRATFHGIEALPAHAVEALRSVRGAQVGHHIAELEVQLASHRAYFAVTLEPLRGALGATTGVIVVCAETTDQVLATRFGVDETALVWGGASTTNPDYYNRRWRRYAGDRDWRKSIHQDDLARWTSALGEAARQRVSTEVEVRLRREDGEYRWHRVRFASEHDGRWLGCATDIQADYARAAERSELLAQAQAARADAEQANRMKDEFLATVSHELRAPLTTMLLWDRVLRDAGSDEPARQRALDAIHDSAVAQARLVADLLDVARAVGGKLHVDLRSVAIEELVADAIVHVGPMAATQSISIEHVPTPMSPEVLGDAPRLRQVIDNLLSNAIKFSEPGGVVYVQIEQIENAVAVHVRDTGRGIPPEFLTRMFTIFSQSEDALTRSEGGLGLGLAISKQIVELHRGTLVATSGGRGQGATFTMTLPGVSVPRVATPPAGLARPSLDGIHVLVVEDDRRVREALVLLLERAGATADAATSANSAREKIAAREPGIVICDIAMPGEDGYSFVRSVRGAGSRVPVVALTALATESDARRAKAAGFDLHLAKPVPFERLVASLTELLAMRRGVE